MCNDWRHIRIEICYTDLAAIRQAPAPNHMVIMMSSYWPPSSRAPLLRPRGQRSISSDHEAASAAARRRRGCNTQHPTALSTAGWGPGRRAGERGWTAGWGCRLHIMARGGSNRNDRGSCRADGRRTPLHLTARAATDREANSLRGDAASAADVDGAAAGLMARAGDEARGLDGVEAAGFVAAAATGQGSMEGTSVRALQSHTYCLCGHAARPHTHQRQWRLVVQRRPRRGHRWSRKTRARRPAGQRLSPARAGRL